MHRNENNQTRISSSSKFVVFILGSNCWRGGKGGTIHQNKLLALEPYDEDDMIAEIRECSGSEAQEEVREHTKASTCMEVISLHEGSLSVNQKKKVRRKAKFADSFNNCSKYKCGEESCKKLIGMLQARNNGRERTPKNACSDQSRKWTKLNSHG